MLCFSHPAVAAVAAAAAAAAAGPQSVAGALGGRMSGRGGRGGFRGGRGGGGGRGGFRGGRGGGGAGGFVRVFPEAGEVLHEVESQLLVRGVLQQLVPYFNGRIFLENKEEIGKVDEILGPINEMYFSVKLNEGIKAASIKPSTKFFVDVNQTLPLSRFLPKPPISKAAGAGAKSAGGPSRGGRGGGGSRGGAPRGGGRGGFRGAGGFRVVDAHFGAFQVAVQPGRPRPRTIAITQQQQQRLLQEQQQQLLQQQQRQQLLAAALLVCLFRMAAAAAAVGCICSSLSV
ncbi:hypothetical protein Efla_007123 [Eimeria flavescens]